MTNQYRLLRSAERDLLEVTRYVANKSDLETADNLLTRILGTITIIAAHPNIGKPEEQLGHGIFSFPTKRYKIYYRVRRDGISILHVFHSSRDQKKAWDS